MRYHCFRAPLPYARALRLQETIHRLQLASRQDILLLLEHRPVYTAGRRLDEHALRAERARLASTGADFCLTARGGQLTYHGPGQLVGYPLLDLARTKPPVAIRDYIATMQSMIQHYLARAHGIAHVPSDNTGVFLDATTKIASIGVQVRHRLTTHGFALNVSDEPLEWFRRIVACGLPGVNAGCIAHAQGESVRMHDVVQGVVDAFGTAYGRDMEKLDPSAAGELGEAIMAVEEDALAAGDWLRTPSIRAPVCATTF